MKISKILQGNSIPTADFEVPKQHAYYMGNGIVSHNTSVYQDASASILPVYSAFFSEDNKNGSLLVSAKYLALNPIAYGKTFAKHTATEIIDVAAAAQKFIDTGISMELIFDQNRENFTAKELYDAVHYAHQKQVKTIYYIRTIKKNSTLETKEEACAACSG